MAKLLSLVLFGLSLASTTWAMYGLGTGMTLLSEDEQTRSGVLSSDHRCMEFPKDFPANHVENDGSTHCGLWTEPDCSGTLYIVPAHYKMQLPDERFESVIC